MTLLFSTPPARAPASGYSLARESGVIFATSEQELIINTARSTTSNLLINALAGAAKTSTLEFLCKYLPKTPILSLAFNKRIAEELTARLPDHVVCRTMNSMGHRVWGTAVGRKLTMNFRKSYEALSAGVGSLKGSDKDDAYETFSDTLKIIGFAKRVGYVPDGKFPSARRLLDKESFYASCDSFLEEPATGLQFRLVEDALFSSIQQSYSGTIDFDDQIYMPTLFGGTFPKFPLVLVDEAQDLSEINHAMLAKLATGRLIAVGDPWQSIYAFRGAKRGGMQSLESHYHALSLPLTVSFRCPEAIVAHVRWRVPHMKWSKPGGTVASLPSLACGDIPDGSAVICRNNAPLFRLALLLLGAGRGVHLVGTDLGPGLVKTLKKLGLEDLTREQTLDAIDQWEAERLAKSKAKAAIADKAGCLRVFAEFGETLGGAVAYCEHLFAHRGAIQLLTGHKAKGLEWPVVFHLDPRRIPTPFAETEEDIEQEMNLRYVISTRAKEELYEIDLERIVTDVH